MLMVLITLIYESLLTLSTVFSLQQNWKYMATIVKSDVTGKKIVHVKGAPDILMNQVQYIGCRSSELQW